jgi:hypothetical protein
LLAVPSKLIELFRCRGAAKDGGTLEYVLEVVEQNSPNAVTKEKAAEIAADFMTTFTTSKFGALETQEFRTAPAPFWLYLPFRVDQKTSATNGFRSATGWAIIEPRV